MNSIMRTSTAVVLISATCAFGSDRPPISRLLLHNTVRIETIKADGAHVGTGFFYIFRNSEMTSAVPVVVTCWHVVSDAQAGRLHFALGTSNALERTVPTFTVQLPQFGNLWLRHPDPAIDLAILPLAPLMTILENEGKRLDFMPLEKEIVPKDDEAEKYSVFQEVKFIGYPIGISDMKNNLPIVRRGMTATDMVVDYNGKPEFLVDAAVFPGSSGSPVFIVNEGIDPFAGQLFAGTRIRFIGILYGVHQYTSEGKIEIITIPTAFDAKVRTGIPANLGIVTKARNLDGFEPLLNNIIEIQKKMANNASEGIRRPADGSPKPSR